MLVPMYQYLSGVESGVFGEHLVLRLVNPFWDKVLSESAISAEKAHEVVNTLLDAMEYHLADIGDSDMVEITKEGGEVVATSDNFLFAAIPPLSNGEMLYAIEAEGVKESGLTASQVCGFINRTCGADKYVPEDITWLVAKHLFDGFYLSEAIEFSLCNLEFSLTVQ